MNLMSKTDTNKTALSPLYPYYQRLMAQANTQFAEAAQKMIMEMKANLALAQGNAMAGGGSRMPPTTPQLELARQAQAVEQPIDILRSKDHLQGVYIKK